MAKNKINRNNKEDLDDIRQNILSISRASSELKRTGHQKEQVGTRGVQSKANSFFGAIMRTPTAVKVWFILLLISLSSSLLLFYNLIIPHLFSVVQSFVVFQTVVNLIKKYRLSFLYSISHLMLIFLAGYVVLFLHWPSSRLFIGYLMVLSLSLGSLFIFKFRIENNDNEPFTTFLIWTFISLIALGFTAEVLYETSASYTPEEYNGAITISSALFLGLALLLPTSKQIGSIGSLFKPKEFPGRHKFLVMISSFNLLMFIVSMIWLFNINS